MRFRALSLWIAASLLAAALPVAAAPAGDAPGLNVLHRDSHGIPAFVTGKLGTLPAGERGQAAAAFLKSLVRREFEARGTEELEVRRVRQDDLGKLHIKTQQKLHGLPVVGAELILHADAATGEVFAVNGRFIPDNGLPRDPAIDPERALITAYITAGIQDPKVIEGPALTYVVDTEDGAAYLAWSVLVAYEDSEGMRQIDRVFADAVVGGLVDRHPQVHSARNRETYDAEFGTELPGTLVIRETETSDDAAFQTVHNHTATTYDYYWNRFGRDSLNGTGMTLVSSIHYGASHNNAYWWQNQMIYGDGDGNRYGPFGNGLDVVGHEMTHGVTSFESGLVYSNESGALNESISDIFGAAVEAWADGGINADTWKVGEDVFTPNTGGDAMRYMDNPTRDGASKDYYPERYTGDQDSGGVHWNSGISNLAFHRLVVGGGHPRYKNHIGVPAIGLSKAEAIFYRAQTDWLTSTSGFHAMRDATISAAGQLFGANSAEQDAVSLAWCMVGVFGTGCPPINLTGSGITFAGRRMADITWLNTGWPAFDVFRNGVKVGTTYSSYYRDTFTSTSTSANYWVCWAGSTTWYNSRYCSNVTTVGFPYAY